MLTEKDLAVGVPLLSNYRPRWICFNTEGIAHYVGGANQQPANKQYKPYNNAISKGNVRSICRNNRGERVDGGAKHANTGTNHNNGDAGNCIVAEIGRASCRERV